MPGIGTKMLEIRPKRVVQRYRDSFRKYGVLHLFLLVPVAYIITFKYIPIYGVQIAFREYNIRLGYWNSPWVGFKHFAMFLRSPSLWPLIRNTFVLSLYQMVAGFVCPIIFALMINEVVSTRFRRAAQMISYIPHFISVVIVVSILFQVFSLRGLVNNFLEVLGFPQVSFFSSPKAFRHFYVWSGVWQTLGYQAIIYIAALAKVDPQLYEAAHIDGATKFQRLRNIDVPAIVPTMIILGILRTSNLLEVGFEKVYLMQNPVNLQYSEVISTFVYKVGLIGSQYSYSAAVGLFNSITNLILLIAANKIARQVSETSLW